MPTAWRQHHRPSPYARQPPVQPRSATPRGSNGGVVLLAPALHPDERLEERAFPGRQRGGIVQEVRRPGIRSGANRPSPSHLSPATPHVPPPPNSLPAAPPGLAAARGCEDNGQGRNTAGGGSRCVIAGTVLRVESQGMGGKRKEHSKRTALRLVCRYRQEGPQGRRAPRGLGHEGAHEEYFSSPHTKKGGGTTRSNNGERMRRGAAGLASGKRCRRSVT